MCMTGIGEEGMPRYYQYSHTVGQFRVCSHRDFFRVNENHMETSSHCFQLESALLYTL